MNERREKAIENIVMKEKLQVILTEYSKDCDNGGILDMLIGELKKGEEDEVELVRYFIEDTTEEGDDYLTDYQCIEIVVGTYELDWEV